MDFHRFDTIAWCVYVSVLSRNDLSFRSIVTARTFYLIISNDRYVLIKKLMLTHRFIFSNSILRRTYIRNVNVKQILQNISFLATIQQFVLRDGSADVREHLFLENVRFASVNKQVANCGTKVEATELKFRNGINLKLKFWIIIRRM